MTTLNTLEDVFVHELQDLYSAERQLIKALPKVAKKANEPRLVTAIEEHLRQTEEHASRLEQILDGLGKRAGGIKCKGMEGLIEEGSEVIEMEGDESALDAALIGAAQRVEHYEIAGYGTAIAHAQATGNANAVLLLELTLREEKEADKLLSQIAESGINEMATAAEDVEPSVGKSSDRESLGDGRRTVQKSGSKAKTTGRSTRGSEERAES